VTKIAPLIFELTVSLQGADLPFWRRFLTQNTISFYRLHLQLQCILHWRSETPFRFQFEDLLFGDPQVMFLTLPNEKNARSSKIGKYLSEPGQSFLYEYDFISI